ncbi:MAG TPA: FtsX-like permease family protein [Acidimicrobiales bacterium]|nr:FtsX-like permease family protein [Acidimicrobiales bacterium]
MTRVVRVVRLAGRLTAGGGRESVVRLVLTGAGLALAVTMLLFAAVAFPALHAHDVRRAWTQTTPDNRQPAQDESTSDPLRWRQTEDRFDGHDLLRVDLAAEGPDAPVPPGLDRLPAPGEMAVSPALRDLLDRTERALLGDRFPDRVTAIVGRDALASPDDLVAFVGRTPDELQARGGDDPQVGPDGTVVVRSIESAPVSRGLTREMRVVFVIGGLGLLIPVIVFVATATRLAAARREQRLAAMRLAGATLQQVGTVSAVEAAVAAVGGTVVGFGAFLAIRPSLARIPFDGATFYPSDLHLSWAWAVLVAVGVPLLAVGAATVSLRRIRISPLGVARRATPARPTARPLLLVVVGMVGLVAVAVWARSSRAEEAETYAAGAAFVVMILGIVLSGPWLTALVARGVARFGRRAPSLLAARRLQDNPAAGFRAISGIVLAVFVGTVFAGITASVLAGQVPAGGLAADVVVAASQPGPDVRSPAPGTPAASTAGEGGPGDQVPALGPAPQRVPQRPSLDPVGARRLVSDLAAIDGVERVVIARAVPDDPELFAALARSGADLSAPVLVDCADVAPLGLEPPPESPPCDGATILTVAGTRVDASGFSPDLSADEVADLPIVAAAAVTDGRTSALEQARTRLEQDFAGSPALTGGDLDEANRSELDTLQRVSNIGLSVTLVIAGCSLAVAVAGAIVERRHAFALLRLAGTRLSDLRRVVLAEAAAPLLIVAAASSGLGLVVADLVLAAGGGQHDFALPTLGYWLALVGGLGVALLVVLATLPLLQRLTALDTTRFE